MSTRRSLLTLAGLAALGAGAWWSWRHTPPAAQAGDPLPADFWSQQFDTLAGPALRLASLQGRPIVLNFWATWCPPCIKEMPELERFHREFAPQGWQVVGLAIDGPTPVREFLAKTPVGFPIGLAGFGGTELAKALGDSAGGLPFSVLIDARGRLRQRKIGAITHDELSAWAHRVQG
ncbi:MAG: TlpA family protein disulfide reductase [Burkholderiales bacterium]|nr:TlpA family protein disulfide reductase [Burkholderiales bacterium]